MISDNELSNLIIELQPKISKYKSIKNVDITLFELETIIALLYFYRNNTDFVVLETGLGGLYDCTNIISNPLVSIITSIGYDHMRILGNTLVEIAEQKAGIIKSNSNTIFFEQTEEINNVFKNKCTQTKNNLHLISMEQVANYSYDKNFQYFNFKNLQNVEIVLKGPKQVQNSCLCIECINILNNLGYKISEENLRKGLKTVVHKARLETLSNSPLIIFDGAHNEPAIQNLKESINMYYKGFQKTFVISILKRKDYKKMIKLLLKEENANFIVTSGNDPDRYVSKEELYNTAITCKKSAQIQMLELSEALDFLVKKSKADVNFIIGSFYVYSDVIKKFT